MSLVRQTERLDDKQSLATMPDFSQEHSSKTLLPDYGIPQLFDKNTFVKSPEVKVDEPLETAAAKEPEDPEALSFWKRFVQFASSFIEPDKFKEQIKGPSSEDSTIEETAPGDVGVMAPREIINPVPVLDPPDMSVPIDFGPTVAQQRKLRNRKNEILSAEQFETALSLMSNRTIEQIMAIILKAQLVLEQENAEVAATTHDKYEAFKTMNQKLLEEIKDALVRDEKVAGYLKTSQNIALCASLICGMAAVAVTSNALPFLENFGGPGKAAASFIQGLSTIGAAVSGLLTGVATGSKAYFDSRKKEDDAKRTHYSHKDKTYADYLDDARERLMVTAEADQFFKERLINQAKRIRKMSKQLK